LNMVSNILSDWGRKIYSNKQYRYKYEKVTHARQCLERLPQFNIISKHGIKQGLSVPYYQRKTYTDYG